MTVDTFITGRRYPQIIISDQDVPVQYNMKSGYAIVVQTFVGWPNTYQARVCDHKYWDVNNQCPAFDMLPRARSRTIPARRIGLLRSPEVGEHMRPRSRAPSFDAYTSTKRVYMFLDGQPYGCANLPPRACRRGRSPSPSATCSTTPASITLRVHPKALQVSTRRHFDNLGLQERCARSHLGREAVPVREDHETVSVDYQR